MQNGEERSDQGSETASEKEDNPLSAAVIAPGIIKSTRLFSLIPDKYQVLAIEARTIVERYALYQKPLLTPGEVLQLLERAQDKSNKAISMADILPKLGGRFICMSP